MSLLSSTSSRQHHNAALAVHKLPNEIISEIFLCGWESIPNPDIASTARSQYRASLSSVCSLWHSLIITDPRFWTYIHLSDSRHPISWTDEERVSTTIRRSGSLPLQIRINFTEGHIERTPSLKRCLALLKAPEQLGRCDSVHVVTTSGAGWEEAFPLQGEMSLLREMRVVSSLQWESTSNASEMEEDAWETRHVSFFANTPPRLERLELNIEHPHPLAHQQHPRQGRLPGQTTVDVNLLAHINPQLLHSLSLRAHIPHEDALSFVQACRNLENLELELRAEDAEDLFDEIEDEELQPDTTAPGINGGAPHPISQDATPSQKAEKQYINGIHCPSLSSLKLYGPSATMLSSIIHAPFLSSLHYSLRDEEEVFALSYALLAASQAAMAAGENGEMGLEGLERTVLELDPFGAPILDATDLNALHQRHSSHSHSFTPSQQEADEADGHLYPHLKELTITGDYSLCAPADAIAAFVSSSFPSIPSLSLSSSSLSPTSKSGARHFRELETIRLTNFANSTEIMELLAEGASLNVDREGVLSSSSSRGIDGSNTSAPSSRSVALSSSIFSGPSSSLSSPATAAAAPSQSPTLPASLTHVILIDSPLGDQFYPPVSYIAPSLQELMSAIPGLDVTWVRPEAAKRRKLIGRPLAEEMDEAFRGRVREVVSED